MNKKILIPILTLLIICVSFLIYKISNTITAKAVIANNVETLPSFQFYNMKGQIFTKDSLIKNTPTLLIYFNSDCEHCQYEASEITKKSSAFIDNNVLFISNQSFSTIKNFDSIYHLTQYPFIKLLKDSTDNFYKTFGISTVPSLILYNSKGNLIKTYKGEVSIDNIIKQLNISE